MAFLLFGRPSSEASMAATVPLCRLIPAVMLMSAVTACTATSNGSISHYWGVPASNVSTRCGSGYRVFRYRDEPKILVSAYVGSYIYRSACERNGPVEQRITGVDHEEAAAAYIEDRPALKGCRITGGTSLSPLHSEFILSCPTALRPAAKSQNP